MPNDRIVGLVRKLRRRPESEQRSHLAGQCGRIWSWDERDLLIRYLRQGDVVVICAAHVLGPTRADVEALLMAIFAKRAAVYDLDSGLRADGSAEAVQLTMRAVSGLTGDSRVLTTAEASRAGKLSGKRKRAERTSDAVAGKWWRSKAAAALTLDEAMRHPAMQGWTAATAYRRLGTPRRGAGRPKKT